MNKVKKCLSPETEIILSEVYIILSGWVERGAGILSIGFKKWLSMARGHAV